MGLFWVRLDHTTCIGLLGLVHLVSWLVNLLRTSRDLLVTVSLRIERVLKDDKEKLWKARRLAKERWQVFVVVYEFWLQGCDKALLVAQVGDVRAREVYSRVLRAVVETVDKTLQAREEVASLLKFHMKRSQDGMKSQADKHITNRQFEVGNWVYLKLQWELGLFEVTATHASHEKVDWVFSELQSQLEVKTLEVKGKECELLQATIKSLETQLSAEQGKKITSLTTYECLLRFFPYCELVIASVALDTLFLMLETLHRFGAFPRGGLLFPPHGGLSNCLAAVWADFLEVCPNQNVPAQAPTRTDEQILPYSLWLQIGKSNLLFDVQKIQKNPIFQISVDILRNTSFFRAFSASASVPAIYIQQFWNTMKYDEKTRDYCCQFDEQWFNLSADLLRKALDITHVDPAYPFELPPTGDTVIDFVNQLGYPEPVEYVSNILTNQDTQCYKCCGGIVTYTNVDHAELLWEEFTQGIQTFFSHKASHNASLKDPKKKAAPLLIPYGRFTKMIIYYLGSTSDVHRRLESPHHLPGDDFLLGNLKFISKGETNEVFRMAIPKQLIIEAIQQSSYYPKYLEMVSKNTKKTPQVRKPSIQLVDEEDEPQREGNDSDLELAKKLSLESHHEKGEGEDADADLEQAIKLSMNPSFLPQGRAQVGGVAIRERVAEEIPKLPETVGKGKAKVTEEQVAHSLIDLSKKICTTDQFILQRRGQASHDSTTGPSSQPQDDTSENAVYESSSSTDSERTESRTEATAPKVDEEKGEVASTLVKSRVGISVQTEGQTGPD
ncbi:hypothetical protein Tco_0189871 [Tanacetum coccineum]